MDFFDAEEFSIYQSFPKLCKGLYSSINFAMGILLNQKTNNRVFLRSYHVFGRHPGSSNTLLGNPEASRIHASILWNGSYWTLKDSSSNGTFVNNKAIVTAVKVALKCGDKICFGNIKASPWILMDDSAPKSMLVPIKSEEPVLELESVVVIPNENNPQITLYQEPNGDWLCENNSGIMRLESGSKVSIKHKSWYFVNAKPLDETKKADQLTDNITTVIRINFSVSRNEEHVSLGIVFEGEQIDLGERTHHYLLLVLARKRINDQQSGVEESEQGWVDKDRLCQQLGLDENHINIQIYRLRKQLMQVNPMAVQLLQIIERRRGEIRFGLDTLNTIVSM